MHLDYGASVSNGRLRRENTLDSGHSYWHVPLCYVESQLRNKISHSNGAAGCLTAVSAPGNASSQILNRSNNHEDADLNLGHLFNSFKLRAAVMLYSRHYTCRERKDDDGLDTSSGRPTQGPLCPWSSIRAAKRTSWCLAESELKRCGYEKCNDIKARM